MIYFIISLIFYILLLTLNVKKNLHMLQQNTYNREHRHIKWILKNIPSLLFNFDVLVFIPFVLGLMTNSIIIYIVAIITYIYLYVIKNNKRKKEQLKKPLVYTSRINRLIITYLIITALIVYLIFNNFDALNVKWYYLVLGLYAHLTFLIIYIVNWINYPIEKLVYLYYFNKSQVKLRSMPNLKIIGITGSYGKTTTKNILNSILSEKYQVLASPKSYNTRFGLMRTINENLDKFDQIFIAEMGAIRKGDIKSICKIVHPEFGILTKIGMAHLETFKSVENIVEGKFQLIDALPKTGKCVLNMDDPYQVEHYKDGAKEALWIGIDNQDADVLAKDIKATYEGTTFNVVFKGEKEEYEFKTNLLGSANIYNILSCLAMAKILDVSIKQMQAGVRKLKPVEHRLELKQYGDINIIDDAFNSNPIGSKMAVDVLAMMPGKKIIVTPGMIELGEKEEELNEEFGRYMVGKVDNVILIGENQTKPIYNGLIKEGFKKEDIYILNDVKKAFGLMQTLKEDKTYVLLENDLPDLFNEQDKK